MAMDLLISYLPTFVVIVILAGILGYKHLKDFLLFIRDLCIPMSLMVALSKAMTIPIHQMDLIESRRMCSLLVGDIFGAFMVYGFAHSLASRLKSRDYQSESYNYIPIFLVSILIIIFSYLLINQSIGILGISDQTNQIALIYVLIIVSSLTLLEKAKPLGSIILQKCLIMKRAIMTCLVTSLLLGLSKLLLQPDEINFQSSFLFGVLASYYCTTLLTMILCLNRVIVSDERDHHETYIFHFVMTNLYYLSLTIFKFVW